MQLFQSIAQTNTGPQQQEQPSKPQLLPPEPPDKTKEAKKTTKTTKKTAGSAKKTAKSTKPSSIRSHRCPGPQPIELTPIELTPIANPGSKGDTPLYVAMGLANKYSNYVRIRVCGAPHSFTLDSADTHFKLPT